MRKYGLADKTVIVTGGAGGIGAATARALVARGAMVVLVDLSRGAVETVAASLSAERVEALTADVTSLEQMIGVLNGPCSGSGR